MNENEANISASRKDDHVKYALAQAAVSHGLSDFDDLQFIHHALDTVDIKNISPETTIFGKQVPPLYINAMTGGSAKTGEINANLAVVARETGVAIASGSMSPIFKDINTSSTFKVLRDLNQNGLLFANVNANVTADNAQRAVDLVAADALQIHINSVQELAMTEGDREFEHWATNIERIVSSVDVPVIVKEVGFGISAKTTKKLLTLGVKNIDVSGSGGTNFASIEQSRARSHEQQDLSGWGMSTVQSLLDNSKTGSKETTFFASGGIRNPMDVAKSLALGAKAVGVAGKFLHTLDRDGVEALIASIESWKETLLKVQSLLGAKELKDFSSAQIFVSGKTADFCAAREISVKEFLMR